MLRIKEYTVLYNPLPYAIQRKINLLLYYTGLNEQAALSINGTTFENCVIDQLYQVDLDVTIPASGHTWVIIK